MEFNVIDKNNLLFDKDNDTIQERANPNHDPKTGKFTNGIKTKEDYLNKALNLVQSPCGNRIEGYKTNLGQICRYDTKTNYYVKGDPQKGIFTMFKPNEGRKYFSHMKEYETGDKKWKKK